MYFLYDFLNNIFFSLAYFVIRIQYIIHITYKICVNRLFMLSLWFPVNRRLLMVKSQGTQSYMWTFNCTGVSTPNPCVVPGSTVYCMCVLISIVKLSTNP